MPAPRLLGRLNAPVAWYFARKVDATGERVRSTLAMLPAHLDHVEALLGEGTIGGPEPNAADFQIGATVRALLSFADLSPAIEGREAARFARSVLPGYPTSVPSGFLPEEWLEPLRG